MKCVIKQIIKLKDYKNCLQNDINIKFTKMIQKGIT